MKIPMMYFTELEQVFQKIHMKPQKTLNNNNLEKEEQSWRIHATLYQAKLKGHSNQQHGTGIKKDT